MQNFHVTAERELMFLVQRIRRLGLKKQTAAHGIYILQKS